MSSTPTRIAVTGATGRMGRELLSTARGRADVTVAVAASRTPDAGPIAGHDLDDASRLGPLFAERDVDVLVDFTAPDASVEYVADAEAAGAGAIVGTTGFDDEGLRALRAASERIPLLRASNFARGVQTLAALVADAAAALPQYDAEVIETHHRGKRDAPSGTASMLADELERARRDTPATDRDDATVDGEHTNDSDAVDGEHTNDSDAVDGEHTNDPDTHERVYGREGASPRSDDEIGIHAVRAGGVAGEHEVLLAGDEEVLTMGHRAADRSVFAEGALDAAVRLDGRSPGRYDVREVLGLRTAPFAIDHDTPG